MKNIIVYDKKLKGICYITGYPFIFNITKCIIAS